MNSSLNAHSLPNSFSTKRREEKRREEKRREEKRRGGKSLNVGRAIALFLAILMLGLTASFFVGCSNKIRTPATEATTGVKTEATTPIDTRPPAVDYNLYPVKAEAVIDNAVDAYGNPKVLDSYIQNDYYYYLVDAGYVNNVYLQTLWSFTYSGGVDKTILSYSEKSTVSSTTSTTLTTAHQQTHNINVNAGIKFGPVSISSAEYKFNDVSSSGKSQTSTELVIKEKSVSSSYEYTFKKGIGTYRLALYSVCDVYYVIKTDKQKELKSMDIYVCARPDEVDIKDQFSSNGKFPNDVDKKAEFAPDFWKSFATPTNDNSILTVGTWTAEAQGAGSARNKDIASKANGDTYWGHSDQNVTFVNENGKKLDINALKALGKTTVMLTVQFDSLYTEKSKDSYQIVGVYFLNEKGEKGDLIETAEFQNQTGVWKSDNVYEQTINIDALNRSGEFGLWLDWGSRNPWLWSYANWTLGKTTVTIEFT